jgi:hypothetical protein
MRRGSVKREKLCEVSSVGGSEMQRAAGEGSVRLVLFF